MTGSLLVRGLVKRLEAAGYQSLGTPFRVASVDFEFTAALLGTAGRGLDLILIVDTATGDHGDRDAAKVRQRVEALSRALDITASRYVLTVILAGASLQGDIEAISATCRVLTIEHAALDGAGLPVGDAAAESLDDHIRVLLPLDLRGDDAGEALQGDPIAELLSVLPKTVDSELVRAITEASMNGEEAVTKALGTRLEEVLSEDEQP
ncbi:hypothetical protein [Bradyrhizobium yuanmingense]|uniref:hypothetical protein n=1 Tax=Bradyrhizobium yuanmingense TaxID=108015 RepID=UPI001CD36185|nr:hypothetical protein [Bradyrhizobium yuanmingense]MCA1529944.1 hypothetical protein [Bradyrhizobium yuanmingense]